MPSVLLHRDQVPTDAALVRALLAEQHPERAGLPVTLVASSGTDHGWGHLPLAGDAVDQAVQALPYYWSSNPPMVAQAARALAAAVAETA